MFLFVSFSFILFLQGEFFLSRVVGMETTDSYDFDTALSSAALVQPSTSSVSILQPQSPALYQRRNYFSSSSYSLINIAPNPEDDILGNPFITTPEPSLSPRLPIHAWDLLPLMQPSPPIPVNNVNNIIGMEEQRQQDLFTRSTIYMNRDSNNVWMPSFGMIFMGQRNYESFSSMAQPPLQPVEFNANLSQQDKNESAKIYEIL